MLNAEISIFGAESMQNAATWQKINAGRSKFTENPCRTLQFGPEWIQNAEFNMTENQDRTQQHDGK